MLGIAVSLPFQNPTKLATICGLAIVGTVVVLADQEAPDDERSRTIFAQIRLGNTKAISAALKQASFFESRDDDGNTPLMHAAFYLDAPWVERFLKKGADPNATNKT